MIARAGQPSVHCLGLAGVCLLLLLAATALPPDAEALSVFACPFRAATGIPCLTCGCTHAFQYVVRGRFLAALGASPLGTALAVCAAAHAAWTALRLCGLPWAPAVPGWPRARVACLVALAANWVFVALRHRP